GDEEEGLGAGGDRPPGHDQHANRLREQDAPSWAPAVHERRGRREEEGEEQGPHRGDRRELRVREVELRGREAVDDPRREPPRERVHRDDEEESADLPRRVDALRDPLPPRRGRRGRRSSRAPRTGRRGRGGRAPPTPVPERRTPRSGGRPPPWTGGSRGSRGPGVPGGPRGARRRAARGTTRARTARRRPGGGRAG